MTKRTPEEWMDELNSLTHTDAQILATISQIQSEAILEVLDKVATAISGIILDQSDEDASWSMRGACMDIVVRLIEAEKEKKQ